MTLNSKGNLDPESEASLERALEGKPPEVKARVRNIALKRNIHVKDPLWEIIIALDLLAVLIEDSPERWETTFAEFQSELDAWATSNLNLLRALAEQTHNLAVLSQSSEQLSGTLDELTAAYNALVDPLQNATESLEEMLSGWEKVKRESLPQIDQLRDSVDKQRQQIVGLTKAVQELQRSMERPAFLRGTSWKGAVVAVAAVYAIAFSGVSLVTLGLYLRDRPLLIETHQEIQRLLE